MAELSVEKDKAAYLLRGVLFLVVLKKIVEIWYDYFANF